jgi:hypothetical protein
MATGATVSGMLTTSQLTPAQRRIRESIRTRPPDLQLRAQHHHLEFLPLALFIVGELLCTGALVVAAILWI